MSDCKITVYRKVTLKTLTFYSFVLVLLIQVPKIENKKTTSLKHGNSVSARMGGLFVRNTAGTVDLVPKLSPNRFHDFHHSVKILIASFRIVDVHNYDDISTNIFSGNNERCAL